MTQRILLIGSGTMSIEYAKVLQGLRANFLVIGRGEKSASTFRDKTGIEVVTGGLEKWLQSNDDLSLDLAIISTSVVELKNCAILLIKKGCKSILLEKPGGLSLDELSEIEKARQELNATVLVAYNRRFYASVLEAKRMIEEDGGVLSFTFEFTEWSFKIESLPIVKELKENWFYANSTHVIDLAFFLGGKPKELCSFLQSGLSWHPQGSIFTGAGKTESGALFSYSSNWESPGRWRVELMTKKHRFLFSPLEKLQVLNQGTIQFNVQKINDSIDLDYKPGLFLQVKLFLEGKNLENFVTLKEQIANWKNIYNVILKKETP